MTPHWRNARGSEFHLAADRRWWFRPRGGTWRRHWVGGLLDMSSPAVTFEPEGWVQVRATCPRRKTS